MEEGLKVLTRGEALKDLTTPTGRVLGVVMEQQYGLYRIGFVDGKGGALPEEISGKYTKGELARADLNNYLNEMWDTSDAAVEKSRLKAHREKVAEKEAHAANQSSATG